MASLIGKQAPEISGTVVRVSFDSVFDDLR